METRVFHRHSEPPQIRLGFERVPSLRVDKGLFIQEFKLKHRTEIDTRIQQGRPLLHTFTCRKQSNLSSLFQVHGYYKDKQTWIQMKKVSLAESCFLSLICRSKFNFVVHYLNIHCNQ